MCKCKEPRLDGVSPYQCVLQNFTDRATSAEPVWGLSLVIGLWDCLELGPWELGFTADDLFREMNRPIRRTFYPYKTVSVLASLRTRCQNFWNEIFRSLRGLATRGRQRIGSISAGFSIAR